MCLGAIINARISCLIYSAKQPKTGAVVSRFKLLSKNQFNHEVYVDKGCMENKSVSLLRSFFLKRRIKN